MDIHPFSPTFHMKTARLAKVISENYRIKTFELEARIDAEPGQYVQLWLPGVGERPMSIGDGRPLTFTIAAVGAFSQKMHTLKSGDPVSFRGPLGVPFTIPPSAKTIALIGGGYGVVPIWFLAKRAKAQGIKVVSVIGARTKEDIIYEHRLRQEGDVHITTDDGSLGMKGNIFVGFEEALKHHSFDAVYACGPERMMFAVAEFCRKKKTPCQVSVERYMKCGINICGACDASGRAVCREGPVMSGEEALKLADFGRCCRDGSGKKCAVH